MRRLVPVSGLLLAILAAAALHSPARSSDPLSGAASRASGVTTITTDTLFITTYNYTSYLSLQVNVTYNIAFPVLNWADYNANRTKTSRPYTRLTLENDWLRVSLLPELGGRVYELTFKPTQHNELYRNPVLKPTHWGPPEQGWWMAAGGIEWGLPVEEHGYESAIPWSYTIAQTADGIGVTLRDSSAPDRLRASVEVFLPNDRAVLLIRPSVENARSVPLDFKWWLNAMLAIGEQETVTPGVRFVFPVDAVTIHSTGDDRLPGYHPAPTGPTAWITWPVYNGIDWSRLENHDEWLGFFGRPQAQQDFVGAYHDIENEGIVRVFPRAIARGIKGFAMGWLHPIGWGTWTDNGTTYFELHGGLAPTFWDSARLNAGQSVAWEEAWYPIAGTGGFNAASAEAALNVQRVEASLSVAVFSTRARAGTRLSVYQRSTCSLLARFDLDAIDPATPRLFTLPTVIPLDDWTVLFTDGDLLLVGYNQQDCVAPVSSVDALAPVSPPAFGVLWSGRDFYSGIAAYDVQVKDSHEGVWTPWITATPQVSATFTGGHGHTYFFRSRARDAQGNLEGYAGDEWGDAFTTVLAAPAAVLETSHKIAPRYFLPGQAVSYTVVLSNTGDLDGHITVTDTLPVSLTLITDSLTASFGPAPTFDGTHIQWSGSISRGESIFIGYALTPALTLAFLQPQTNVVVIEGGVVPVTRAATASMARLVYLPVIARAFTP